MFTIKDRRLLALVLTLNFIALGSVMINSICQIIDDTQIVKTNNRYLITALHVPEEVYKDYTKIYEDASKDYAVYINNKYKPEQLKDGTKVVLAGTVGKVYDSDEIGFYVEPRDKSKIIAGISGTPVYDEQNEAIGFISSSDNELNLYCVYY